MTLRQMTMEEVRNQRIDGHLGFLPVLVFFVQCSMPQKLPEGMQYCDSANINYKVIGDTGCHFIGVNILLRPGA